MNEHRDPVVARALDRLPVPEHAPGFWEDLETRLDAERGELPQARRRNRHQRPQWLAAAAALVLVAGAGVVLLDRDDTKRVVVGNPGETSAPSTTEPSVVSVGTADGAVVDWLEALGRGDEQTAAALVGPKSRRYIESLGGNVEGMMRESEEGYGAWAASPDRSTTEIDLGTIDGAATTIVVVTGTWSGEGETGFRSDAIPAVRTGNGWVVEPMAFDPDTGGRLEVQSPTRSDNNAEFNALAPDDVITVSAAGSGDFYFSLDDSDPVRVAGERTGGGVRATWDPPGVMSEQTHLFVVAYADGDTLTAFAGRFRVNG